MADCVWLAAATSLAWLHDCFPLHLRGATDDGEERMECSSTNWTVHNQGWMVLLQSSRSGLLLWFGRRMWGGRDYGCCHFFFSWKIPPIIQFVCKGNVGCGRCWLLLSADCSASPSSSARTRCFLYIYLYLYISIYICFPFPVSHQWQYVAAGTSVLVLENPDWRPLLNGSLAWVGPDMPAPLHGGQDSWEPEAGGTKERGGQGNLVTFVTHL